MKHHPNQGARTKALEALLTGGTITDAARAADVTWLTAQRWSKSPEFVEALEQQRAEALRAARQALSVEVAKSIRVLRDLRDADDTPPHVRRQCAVDILDRAGIPKVSAIELATAPPPEAEDVAEWLASQAEQADEDGAEGVE